jgi:CheY-like chemotaxis protein
VTERQPRIINVLLVEDDPGDVLMTREAFDEYLHNRLDVVTDGAAALSYLRSEEPYSDAPATAGPGPARRQPAPP